MTVRELIRWLAQQNPDAVVYTSVHEMGTDFQQPLRLSLLSQDEDSQFITIKAE